MTVITPLLLSALHLGALPSSSSLPRTAPDSTAEAAIAARVEIVRTEYGVPHVFADDVEAMGFALGWLQSEDHGDVAAVNLVKGRGEYARYVGYDSIDGDFEARETYARAVETWHRLLPETRAVYEGFAAGVNHYVRLHREEFPDWLVPDFTGIDAHAREIQSWSRGDARAFVRALERAQAGTARPRSGAPDHEAAGAADTFALDGSNAWAFAPSRTTSGHAILLRNPHLTWGAGYYEAHVRVPGVLEFYGDFRIGGAFGIIGGFNRHLGWATTNNYPTYSQVYALEKDPADPARYLLDGRSHPLMDRSVTVAYRIDDGGLGTETRTTRHTPYGPVIHETDDAFYILKDPRDGEFRRGEQFLRMMQAESLEAWLDIMEMRAHPSSNFTYADAAGNIVHLYNARLPLLPHEPTGDTAALARSAGDIWSELVPVSEMPLWVNPPGGVRAAGQRHSGIHEPRGGREPGHAPGEPPGPPPAAPEPALHPPGPGRRPALPGGRGAPEALPPDAGG
ncbi:MAG TPA: penicillin acylase family protein, partial [Longimicrobiales bacterium]|nr:penicillin acylase family protein [Longimicrobiales bacterium]